MSARIKPSCVDGRLQQVFGAPVAELYETAVDPGTSAALTRALELRSFLALAEEQVARVRDRVHATMAADHDMDDLSADTLRMDAYWLEAALDARNGYRGALDELLRTMPPPGGPSRRVHTTQLTATTTLGQAVTTPAPQRAGTARPRRP
ncbi:hypothetical protein [Streptomyces calvus]